MASSLPEMYASGVAVVPHDTNKITPLPRALYVGTVIATTGTITITGVDGVDYVLTGVVAGSIIPIQFLRVKTSGTDASDMVALN